MLLHVYLWVILELKRNIGVIIRQKIISIGHFFKNRHVISLPYLLHLKLPSMSSRKLHLWRSMSGRKEKGDLVSSPLQTGPFVTNYVNHIAPNLKIPHLLHFWKVSEYVLNIPSQNSFHMRIFLPHIESLLCLSLLSMFLCLYKKLWLVFFGCKLWMKRWLPQIIQDLERVDLHPAKQIVTYRWIHRV